MPDNLQILLNRLKLLPIPEAPVPADLGPLDPETARAFAALNPEPVPPAFAAPAPIDTSFVNQYAGAAPTAPAPRSRGERIANALAGFGAGFRGQGAEFLEQLDQPRRAYEAQLERYQGRRAQGVELAERRAEREAERANRASELQYQRDLQVWLKKNDVRSDEAAKQAQYAFELLRDARRFDAEDKRQKAQEEKQLRLKAADLARAYRLAGAVDPANKADWAKELAEKDLGLRESVSPGALKWLSAKIRLDEARADKLARMGAGSGGDGRLMAALENGQIVPASLVDKERGVVRLGGQPVKVVNYVGGGATAAPPPTQFTTGVEGFGLIPGIETAAPQTSGQTFTKAQVKAHARKTKRKPEDVEAELRARGFNVQ